jgi:hypothetical protein
LIGDVRSLNRESEFVKEEEVPAWSTKKAVSINRYGFDYESQFYRIRTDVYLEIQGTSIGADPVFFG